VFRVGDEPDVRFSLANERTFLGWCRTALAIIAGAVGVEAIQLQIHPALRHAAVVVLLVLGACLPVLAWWDWARRERAMRLHAPLPAAVSFTATAAGITAIAVILGVGFLS
jgi:putative membrane protein